MRRFSQLRVNRIIRRFVVGISLSAAALTLPSCVLSTIAEIANGPHHVPFDESELTSFRGPGSATVSGRMFATWNGEPSFAGSPVTLVPVTRYTTEMKEKELGEGWQLFPSDSRLRKYERKTHSNNQGDFIFTNVPAGEYYVAGEVGWDTPGGDSGDYTHQWVCERITVGSGQSLHVMVTHDPSHGHMVNNFFTFE